MNEQSTILNLLAEDRQIISYRPSFARLTGSVNAAILLQQIFYRWYKNGQQPFFKFKEPCEQKDWKEGDSWCEELAFTRWEFDGALKLIGTKITKGKHPLYNWPRREDFQAENEYDDAVKQATAHIVNYSTDSEHKTWYSINPELFIAAICQPSRTKVEKPRQISGEEKPLSIHTENTRDSNTADTSFTNVQDVSVSQPSNPKSEAQQNTEQPLGMPMVKLYSVHGLQVNNHGFKVGDEITQGDKSLGHLGDESSGTSPMVAAAETAPALSSAAEDCLRYLKDGNVVYYDLQSNGDTEKYTYGTQELPWEDVMVLLNAEYIDDVPDEWMHAGHDGGYRITAKGQARAHQLPSVVEQPSLPTGLFGSPHQLTVEQPTVDLPPAPAGYQYVYTSTSDSKVHLVKAGLWEHGRSLCKATVKSRHLEPFPGMECVKNGVCPDCLKIATAPKPEKKKRVKVPQPYDVWGEALARTLFEAKDQAGINAVYGRVAPILHGDKRSGRCDGLIAYEMERQGKDKASLDYAALATDTEAFWKDYRRANPGCQLKDCAKVVDAWQLWRGKTKPKPEERHYEFVEPDMWVSPTRAN